MFLKKEFIFLSIIVGIFIAGCSGSVRENPPTKPVEPKETYIEEPKKEPQVVVISKVPEQLEVFYFRFNSFVIPKEFNDAIVSLAEQIKEILQEDPSRIFTIEGHADAVGTHKVNDKISRLRASRVKSTLVRLGVNPDNLEIKFYGKRKLKYPTPKAYRPNRRVEVIHVKEVETIQDAQEQPAEEPTSQESTEIETSQNENVSNQTEETPQDYIESEEENAFDQAKKEEMQEESSQNVETTEASASNDEGFQF